jgi:hypothetical protein
MNKILLILTFLATGTGAFHVARQHASQLQQKVQAANVSWQIHTQQLAVAQGEQTELTERFRELKETLAQSQPVPENALWAVIQTNRADRLSPELRQRVLAELGFDWRISSDFVVVSKQTVRDIQLLAFRVTNKDYQDATLTDIAIAVLAITPEERGQVQAALERVKTDFKDWALAHVERHEPTDKVLVHYTLPRDPAIFRSISNNFTSAVSDALGGERAELILPTAPDWAKPKFRAPQYGTFDLMIRKRSDAGKEGQWMADFPGGRYSPVRWAKPTGSDSEDRPLPINLVDENGKSVPFPGTFRPIFPNGWADVAKREGFELPAESEKE